MKKEKALGLIKTALRELEQELARHRKGEGAIGNIAQLQAIQKSLIIMKEDLESNALPPKEDRGQRGFARIILDSWPIPDKHHLGEILCAAENAYRDL